MNYSVLLDQKCVAIVKGSSLNQLMISASPDVIKLVHQMLNWNPERRPTAQQVLKYFQWITTDFIRFQS